MTKDSSDDKAPKRRADDGAPLPSRREGHPLRRASDFGAVLVVDDDRDAVEIVSRLLNSQRLRTIPAYGGEQCLEIARSQPIDLILLDVSMPGMDGLKVCEELAKDDRTRTIPIMLITAHDDHATRLAGMKLGVSEFLGKPFNRPELLERVRGQLISRALARQIEETLKKEPEE